MPETARDFIARKQTEFELERGKLRRFKDIGRKGHHYWLREAWTFCQQGSLAEKVLVIERFRLRSSTGAIVHKPKIGDVEYRIGYTDSG